MQFKNIFLTIIPVFAFLLAHPQSSQPVIIPDSIFYKLKPHCTLTHEELSLSNIIDTAYKVQYVDQANCDTTASLNDSISYLIIELDDPVKRCTDYFLVTVNVNNRSRISNKYLYQARYSYIDYSNYLTYSWEILSKGHVTVIVDIVTALVPRQNFDEKYGDNTRTRRSKKMSFWVKQNGEIVKGRKAPG